MLEYFLNEVGKVPEFKNSKYFCDFLRISDYKKFRELVKFGDKIQRPNKFESLLNMTGYVYLLDEFSTSNFEQLISHEEPIYEKIKDLFKTVTKAMKSITKTLIEIEEQLNLLNNLTKKFDFVQEYEQMIKCT